jgi:hypothetical protein
MIYRHVDITKIRVNSVSDYLPAAGKARISYSFVHAPQIFRGMPQAQITLARK